jgi:hypothetical protein
VAQGFSPAFDDAEYVAQSTWRRVSALRASV